MKNKLVIKNPVVKVPIAPPIKIIYLDKLESAKYLEISLPVLDILIKQKRIIPYLPNGLFSMKVLEKFKLNQIKIDTNPQNLEEYLIRSEAHYQLENWSSAIQDFDKILKLDATKPDIHFKRGVALLHLAEPQAAIESIERAKELFSQESDKSRFNQATKIIKRIVNT